MASWAAGFMLFYMGPLHLTYKIKIRSMKRLINTENRSQTRQSVDYLAKSNLYMAEQQKLGAGKNVVVQGQGQAQQAAKNAAKITDSQLTKEKLGIYKDSYLQKTKYDIKQAPGRIIDAKSSYSSKFQRDLIKKGNVKNHMPTGNMPEPSLKPKGFMQRLTSKFMHMDQGHHHSKYDGSL